MTGVVNVSVFMIGLSAHRDRKYPEHSSVVSVVPAAGVRTAECLISISPSVWDQDLARVNLSQFKDVLLFYYNLQCWCLLEQYWPCRKVVAAVLTHPWDT